jgi:hypothetical protein
MPTYPLDVPTDPKLREATITMVSPTVISQSPFTGKTQRGEQAYSLWTLEGSYDNVYDENISRLWRVFFLELRGRAGTFKMIVPGTETPASGYTGSIGEVVGGSQTGTSLSTDNWDNSTTVLLAGDYFTVNDELKVVTADVTSDGSGLATVNFEPPLRNSPDDNDAFTISNPYFIASLRSDEPSWGLRPPFVHAFSIEAVETF